MERDKLKQHDLKMLGIRVVNVGHWWNGSWSHLMATLERATENNTNSAFA
jgi:hypothetical protein